MSISLFLQQHVRTVPDWPLPGIQFRDITPLIQKPEVFHILMQALIERYRHVAHRPQAIAGLDARGFIFGASLAHALGVGFVPIRKKGKLPFDTLQETYALEYGSATVEIHTDAVQPGEKVLIVDDLVATGGTMMAGVALLRRLGAQVMEAAAIIDLPDLGGSARLREQGVPLFTLLEYPGH
jgi:adenine phosphoribosyltransferase